LGRRNAHAESDFFLQELIKVPWGLNSCCTSMVRFPLTCAMNSLSCARCREVSLMNPDKQYTFRCMERGPYNRVYIIHILGDDEEEARQLAEKADGNITSDEPGRHPEQIHAQLMSEEDVDYDDLLEGAMRDWSVVFLRQTICATSRMPFRTLCAIASPRMRSFGRFARGFPHYQFEVRPWIACWLVRSLRGLLTEGQGRRIGRRELSPTCRPRLSAHL